MAAADIATLAHAYHGLGINVLPIGRNKRPRVDEWERWQTERQTAADLADLPFRETTTVGVAAVVGAISDDILCIDADKAPGKGALDTILGRLGLPREYR